MITTSCGYSPTIAQWSWAYTYDVSQNTGDVKADRLFPLPEVICAQFIIFNFYLNASYELCCIDL